MTREHLKDDLTRILLADMIALAGVAIEHGPTTEARVSILCSRPARNAAERILQELERLARIDAGLSVMNRVWENLRAQQDAKSAAIHHATQEGGD